MTTSEQRVARFVQKKAAVLEHQDSTHSRLKSIIHGCGWQKRSDNNLRQIQSAFEEAGIYPEPMLTAPGLNWDELVYFTGKRPDPYDAAWYAPVHAFPTEKALQRFLIQNFARIPAFRHLKHPETEYRLPSGNRVDILCRERQSNDIVVIELKKGATDAIGQLEKYLVEVNKRLAPKMSPAVGVQGIIISGRPNAAIERDLPNRIRDFRVVWLVYRAKIELFERARVP